ncbi:copper transport protein [Aspergillus brasiliensis]|nr:copper transport protein [Aspergillus brasiliensis]
MPYVLLYASVTTKSFITPRNHAVEMERYPYDKVIFHPGQRCRTCQIVKPARIIAADIRIGAITLLMTMTAPLAGAFLVYHTYLIWAGMTTNESSKWSDWKEEVADGMAYKSSKAEIYGSSPLLAEYQSAQSFWPVSSDQVLILTDGEPPKEGCLLSQHSNEIKQPSNRDAPVDRRWVQVQSMKEIDNIYDLGFWNNLRHVLGLTIRPKVV